MRSGIHPTWHNDTEVVCTCGHTFKTGSTKKKIQVEICANCHPFFTGEMKFVDTQGRVEKFMAKQKAAQKTQAIISAKKKAKQSAEKQQQEAPTSLKEMLIREKKKLQKQEKASGKKPSPQQ